MCFFHMVNFYMQQASFKIIVLKNSAYIYETDNFNCK